jgi:hypothetical protein
MGEAQLVGSNLAEADGAYLALLDQPSHGAHGLFDRHGRIKPMRIVEIDAVDAETK